MWHAACLQAFAVDSCHTRDHSCCPCSLRLRLGHAAHFEQPRLHTVDPDEQEVSVYVLYRIMANFWLVEKAARTSTDRRFDEKHMVRPPGKNSILKSLMEREINGQCGLRQSENIARITSSSFARRHCNERGNSTCQSKRPSGTRTTTQSTE